MARPKMLGEVQALTNNAQSDYFASKYSLRAKAGGNDGLVVGQEIYCLPLVKDGVYEMVCHAVKPRGTQGFHSKYTTYIPCHGYNEDTGETDSNCLCCQLAQEEWDKFVANGKKGETLISFQTSRFLIPVLLLGNSTKSKTASNIPVSQLTMSGRDYSYVELSRKAFSELITAFKNDLLNNGRMNYGLEGADLYNELMAQLQKHILKISIAKPDGFGTHKKFFSFVSFDNKNIGAETNSYKNITEGLSLSKKLQSEVEEYLTLFGNECDGILTEWTDVDLANYIHGSGAVAELEQRVQTAGVPPKAPQTVVPKAEQVVELEEDIADDIGDQDLFDGEDVSDITLDDTPSKAQATSIDIPDEDMSFEVGDEDFFGDE